MQNHWIEDYKSQITDQISKYKWIVAIDILVAAGFLGQSLRKYGAKEIFLLSGNQGTGNIDESFPHINLNISASKGLMEGIYAIEDGFQNLSAEHLARLDEFDPTQEAKVMVSLFGSSKPIAGRQVFGARHSSWMELEDKLIVDALWDEVGIPRQPALILSLKDPEFWTKCQSIDQGDGVVLAGDNRDGWHGGATRIRIVKTPEQSQQAQNFLSQHCDKVRVMPFLEGIPCSIHGWVFPGEVVSLRPCEMLVLHNEDEGSFVYCGVGTSWKPTAEIEMQMKDNAVKVGKYLQEKYGYRGCFTMDGVATKEGFFPTELNPRFGGAMGRVQQSIPDVPLYLLHLCTIADVLSHHYPQQFAKTVIQNVDEKPYVSGMYTLVGTSISDTTEYWIVCENDQWQVVDQFYPNSCQVKLGPNPSGGLLWILIHPSYLGYGQAGAGLLLSALQFLSAELNLPLPRLKSAI